MMAYVHRSERLVYIGLAMATAIWLLGLAAAPWLMANGHPYPAYILYQGFSVICHQMPERSFHYHDLPLAVCARCTGIYAGFLIGLLVYPLWRSVRETDAPPAWWLTAAATPMLLDYSGDLLGLVANTHFSRVVTGGILGAIGAWFVLPALVAFFITTDRSDDRTGAVYYKVHRSLAKGEAE